MKRSEINGVIRDGLAFLEQLGVSLPPQAYWGLEIWNERRNQAGEFLNEFAVLENENAIAGGSIHECSIHIDMVTSTVSFMRRREDSLPKILQFRSNRFIFQFVCFEGI